MTLTFTREPLTRELLSEALPLLREHWAEIAHDKDIPLDVDVESYLSVAAAGNVRCFTARVSYEHGPRDGGRSFVWDPSNLVGYAVFFVRAHLHYQASVQAVQDVLYLHPSVRGGQGAKFIAFCDEQLRADGVQVVHQHQKQAHPQLGRVLAQLGYEAVETIWSKRLDVQAPAATLGDLRARHGVDAVLSEFRHLPDSTPVCPTNFPEVKWTLDGGHTPEGPARGPAQHAGDASGLVDFSESMQALAGAHE